MSDDIAMKAQSLASAAPMAPLTKVTDDELLEMRTRCAQMASQGGEAGAIAADILHISLELQKLTDEANRCLGV